MLVLALVAVSCLGFASAQKCPYSQVWSDCASACVKTCDNPSPVCTEQCVSRCHCPPDKPIWHNNLCITEAQCTDCDTGVSDNCTIRCDSLRPRRQPAAGQMCLGWGCRCDDPCTVMRCPSGTACQFKQVQCVRAPCPPQPQCLDRCPNGAKALETDGVVKSCHDDQSCGIEGYGCTGGVCCYKCPVFESCPAYCPYGFMMDEFGCNMCVCKDACEHGKEYTDCGLSCVPTCTNPAPVCDAACSEGCHCPPERPLWDQGRCVSQDQCGITSRPERCNLAKEMGSCKAYFKRWYFNTAMNKCMSFIFGGCRGNANRFESEDACIAVCVDLTGAGAARPDLPVLLVAALLTAALLLQR